MPVCENVSCRRYGRPMMIQGVDVRQDGPHMQAWRKYVCEQCGGTKEVRE